MAAPAAGLRRRALRDDLPRSPSFDPPREDRPTPLSVLHVLPSLDLRRGGPVTAVIELVAGLNGAGIQSTIAVPSREGTRAAGVPLVACPAWRIPFGPLLRLPRVAPLPGPVVVHVHGLASLVPWSPLVRRRAWVAAVVATLHGVLDWRTSTGLRGPKRLWHDRLDLPLLRRLDGLHVTRPSEVESARVVLGPTPAATCIPWTLLALPAGPRPAVPMRDPTPIKPFLLFVGRLNPIKGIERLLDALARVESGARPRLLLAGAGEPSYVASLSRRARDLGIRDHVELLGVVGGESLRALYADAAALVLPSRYENFGMVVLEAMREGCPVIVARETPWAVLEAEGAGRFVDFEDPQAAAGALTETLDPVRRRTLGMGAHGLYERGFAPSRVIPRFAAWYEEIVARAARRPPP